MAEKIRGVTVKIAADTSDFNKSLNDTNKEIKSTQNQLKDVEKLLKLDPTNVELLRQKQVLLARASKESSDKLKLLNEQLKKMEDAGVDKTSDGYMALQREIAATTQAEQRETRATNRNTKEHNKQGKSLKSVGKALGVVTAAAIASATAMAKFLASTTTQASEYADDLVTLSKQTGISVEKLQELSYASSLVDVEISDVANAIKKNTSAMKKASEYNFEYMEAYELLGVSIYDANGEMRNSSDVFFDVIDALKNVANETERDQIAMTLLGKSATDLNPLIEAGADYLKELSEEAHDVGYVMSDEVVEGFGAFQDTMDRIKNSTTALKNALGKFLLPTLEKLGTSGLNQLKEFTQVANDSESIGDVFEYISDKIDEDIPTITDSLVNVLSMILNTLLENAPRITNTLILLVTSAIDSLLNMDWGTLLSNLLNVLLDIILYKIPEICVKIATSITNIFFGMIKTLFSKEGLEAIGQTGIALGKALINGLISTFEMGLNNIIDMINEILSIEIFGQKIGGSIDHIEFGRLSSNELELTSAFSNLISQVQANAGYGTTNNTTNNYYQNQDSGNIEVSVNFEGDLSGVAEALEPTITATKTNKGLKMVG